MMHSLLFVPAKKKMLDKIAHTEADAVIIDLEDAVAEADKKTALEELKSFLAQPHSEKIFVRLDGNLMDEQLDVLKQYPLVGYMIPKFEDPERLVSRIPLFAEKQIIALVETPLGAVNINQIAGCPWVSAIAFGAEDYTCATGMKNCAQTLHYVKSRLVMYSKAWGKPIYDTPSFELTDMELLQKEAELVMDMGFDGKLAIHPKQIPVINQVFTACDAEYLSDVIARYESSGEAVLTIDGKVYEKMHIAHMKRILKEKKG